MKNPIEQESHIKCPECGYEKKEFMPTDACLYFYTCVNCKETFKPHKGDCCVFCSYGSMPCPPVQQNTGGCC